MGALYFVVHGVTYYDRVPLADGSPDLIGFVHADGDRITLKTADAQTVEVLAASVAIGPDGEPNIQYGLRTTWARSHKWFLVLAVLLQLPVLFPQAYRFRIMLAAQGIKLAYWECIRLSLAGNFLNFAAPLGSNAGDVFKAYFAALHATDRKPEAVATVILDRAIGLGSLLLVVASITLLAPAGSRLSELQPYMLTMFLIGVAAVAAYFSPFLRRRLVPTAILSRLPMYDKLQRLDQSARRLLRHWPTLVTAVVLTILLQALAMLAYFAVAVAVGFDVGWSSLPECFAYFYTGTLVQALPGPPQGLGTVELTYRYFFSTFGSPSQIVSMALAIRLVVLLCALPGLWVTLTGSYRPKDALQPDDAMKFTEPDPAMVKVVDLCPSGVQPNATLVAR